MVSPISTLRIRPSRVFLGLGIIILLLAITGVVTQLVRFEFNMRPVGLIAAFNLNREGNVPTLFSVLLLLFAGFLLWIIGQAKKAQNDPFGRRWKILCGIFFYLALDEAVGIHELCIRPLREGLDARGVFYFSWVIPAMVFLVILGLYFYRFVMHFELADRLGWIASGCIYISGALGMEMLGGRYYESVGRRKDFTYSLLTAAEETLEMIGLAFFIYLLLKYIERELQGFQIAIGERGGAKEEGHRP